MTVKIGNPKALQRNFLNTSTLILFLLFIRINLLKQQTSLYSLPPLSLVFQPQTFGSGPMFFKECRPQSLLLLFGLLILAAVIKSAFLLKKLISMCCDLSFLLPGIFFPYSPTLCWITGRGSLTANGSAHGLLCCMRVKLFKC